MFTTYLRATVLTRYPQLQQRVLFEPLSITLLDLSLNHLKTIDPALLWLTNLATLYLHGNHIEKLAEVDKLKPLEKLIGITLHGNEIEKDKSYRTYVITRLPHLKRLDFGLLTKGDRDLAASWLKLSHTKPKKAAD